MKPYFEKMTPFGRELNEGQIKSTEQNVDQIKEVEAEVRAAAQKVKTSGFPEEKINARGQMTVWQRINYLVDPGTWSPLHTLYNPEGNADGLKEYMRDIPAYHPKFFRVAASKKPAFKADDLYRLIPFNQNQMAQEYHDNSRPIYCAEHGLVDEVVQMSEIRKYLLAFAGSVYQNPKSICPQHQMLLPRSIKG